MGERGSREVGNGGGEGRKAGKMKGGRAEGWEMNAKSGWFQTFQTTGKIRWSRWRVPELAPKTPGPVACGLGGLLRPLFTRKGKPSCKSEALKR